MGIIPKWMKLASGGLDPITKNYVNGMVTKPSADFIKIIDELVKDKEVVNGVSITMKQITALGDVIYLGNINDSNDSFRNLVKNAHHGTILSSGLVWDSYWGYSNPAGTGFVDTNYNPSTQKHKLSLNNVGLCVNQHSANAATGYTLGAFAANYLAINNYSSSAYRCYLNMVTRLDVASIPFKNGLLGLFRTASNAINFKNQNVTNTTGTTESVAIPDTNILLFNITGLTGAYTGCLNFTYIGASLTDDQFTALNIMVNRYLKKCLYLKYGASNWGVQMAKSYFDTLHNFEHYEAWEIYEFIKRHLPDYVDGSGLNIIPSASSDFETDGTAFWNSLVGGSVAYNAGSKCMDMNSTTSGYFGRNNSLVIGRKYFGSITYRSNTYTNKLMFGSNGLLVTNNVTPNWQTTYGIFTANHGTAMAQCQVPHNGLIQYDNIIFQEVQETGYYYNTFGPLGQNKAICDYVLLFKAGGNLTANAWTKSGATLRWDQSRAITVNNIMPAYSRGNNLGIITVSSTDGWIGLNGVSIAQTASSVNSFYGNFPQIPKLKQSGTKIGLVANNNRMKIQTETNMINTYRGFLVYQTYPGYNKGKVEHLIGGSFSHDFYIYSISNAIWITGDVTQITNEFYATNLYFQGTNENNRQDNLVGNLENLILTSTNLVVVFAFCGVTKGMTTWNNNVTSFNLSGCRLSTQAIVDDLIVKRAQFSITPPVKNLIVNYSGATMGVVAANHQVLLDIGAQHVAQNKVFTSNTRTS